MSEASELKPCPFCGSENIDARGWSSIGNISGPACDDCGASAGKVSKSNADNITAWNTRAGTITPSQAARVLLDNPKTLHAALTESHPKGYKLGIITALSNIVESDNET